MRISYNWLQKHIKETLPDPNSLKEVIIFHAFEVEAIEEKGADTIFDIKVLPDRAHDCLSHYGMAREIVGLLGLTLKPYRYEPLIKTPLDLAVEIQSDAVRRYIAVGMRGVTIGPSPLWLREALESIGTRSINNIVDATNYVLFDRGQPVHVFDATKIDGGIVVRSAHEGEHITTLSGEEKIAQKTDVVIADYLGTLALAGVKGGKSAEVTAETNTIIIEIGNFDPAVVRKTSRRLSLITDASKRFENDLAPTLAEDAAAHIVALISEIAGGEVSGVYEYYPHPLPVQTLSFSLTDIVKYLGATVSAETIDLWIARYGIVAKKEETLWTIEIPRERLDITGPHDIAEEVGRMVGYERIPATPLPFTTTPDTTSLYRKIMNVKYWLAQNGFREVMNYSFTKKGDVYIAYGAKDKSALRTNLSDGLKESYEKNRLNTPLLGIDRLRIFEIGTVFLKDKEELRVATADGGVFEELSLDAFVEKYHIEAPGSFSISAISSNAFIPWSVYPFIVRDLAVWVEEPSALGELDTCVTLFAKKYCAIDTYIFDRFEKEGRQSVAYRFVFQSKEKTLTEDEVESLWSILIEEVKSLKYLTLR